jgi:hypothetical protein
MLVGPRSDEGVGVSGQEGLQFPDSLREETWHDPKNSARTPRSEGSV